MTVIERVRLRCPQVAAHTVARANATCPAGAAARPVTAPTVDSLDTLAQVEKYAAQPAPTHHEDPLPAPGTKPPALESWPSEKRISDVLGHACTDVKDERLVDVWADAFDSRARKQITEFQVRQAQAEGSDTMSRVVHRQQLHGGPIEVHWNPHMNAQLSLFELDSQPGLMRLSDSSGEPDPDGPSMFGMALELIGRDGDATDILLTGGTPLVEHSQAPDPQGQLDLFNMMHPPSKLVGLGRIMWDEGPVDGIRMIRDVEKMRTNLDSLADLTAWSRAPFAVQGRDGKQYLVKMRAAPLSAPPAHAETPGSSAGQGTSSERLAAEFEVRQMRGETRWRLDFQFLQPGDDPYDPRKSWHGPWLSAAEIVVPQRLHPTIDRGLWERAERTHFNIWKNKLPVSDSADRNVLKPWGELNRARLAAYDASAGNRGVCPFSNTKG